MRSVRCKDEEGGVGADGATAAAVAVATEAMPGAGVGVAAFRPSVSVV